MNNEETVFNPAELDEDEKLAYALCQHAYNTWVQGVDQADMQETLKAVAYFYNTPQHSPLAQLIAMFFYGYIEGLCDGLIKLGCDSNSEEDKQ